MRQLSLSELRFEHPPKDEPVLVLVDTRECWVMAGRWQLGRCIRAPFVGDAGAPTVEVWHGYGWQDRFIVEANTKERCAHLLAEHLLPLLEEPAPADGLRRPAAIEGGLPS